jgi:hypothetical protein
MLEVGLKVKGIPAGRCCVPLVMYIGRGTLAPAKYKIVSEFKLSSLRSV